MVKIKNARYPLYMIIPALLIYAVFFIYPTLSGFYFSLTDWSLASQEHGISFVGLKNYSRLLFDNDDLYVIIRNTMFYTFMLVFLQNLLGLLFAFLFNRKLTLKNIGRTIVFIPVIVSQVAAGFIFTAIFNRRGIFNQMLSVLGLPISADGWLGNTNTVMTCLVFISLWQWVGFNMTVYLAGMQSISTEYIECAKVEGANSWQTARYIILPLLAPASTVNILLTTIGSMKVFDLVFAVTGGGPGNASMVFMVYVYKRVYDGLFALGVTANVILFIIIFIFTLILLPLLRKREVDLG